MGAQQVHRLSGLDHAFLHFETSTTYMHVALVGIFEAASLGRRDGGIDIERVRAHVASRLHLLPRYRQRLHYVPLTQDPIWVDDDSFDLDLHVRHSNLPRPGTEQQLRALCARLLERPLDRSRPLWEMTFIEGLPRGRFAMLCKVHHCMVDGIAGIELLAALLGVAPEREVPRPVPWSAEPVPSDATLLGDELRRRASASLGVARAVPGLLGAASRSAVASRLGSLWGFVRAGATRAAETPLNQPIGPYRRVEWVGFDLALIQSIRKRLGGTMNDVVLAAVAGAMRRFFAERGAQVDGDFRALVPVSTRAAGEHGGNRVSAWLPSLPIAEPSALERHRLIRLATAEHRESHSERGPEVLTETADWTTAHALGPVIRLIRQTRAFNVIVTNVPGPPLTLYLLDAPMVAAYPFVPLFEGQGVGIALLSYDGRLYFGLAGEWDVMHDLDRFAAALQCAVEELRQAAGCEPAEPRATAPEESRAIAPEEGRARPAARPPRRVSAVA